LSLLLGWTLALAPVLLLCRLLGWPRAMRKTERLIYRGLVRISGFRVILIGAPSAAAPTLYVANHCSYFDIMVLGSCLDAGFIAKQEVAGWPLIGWLAKIAGTLFVERRAGQSTKQRALMRERMLEKRESLILFPEGTSSDGRRVLPFKSALFAVAADGDGGLPVQPISLAYTALDGMPLGLGWRSHFTWYGDMELAPHIWIALGLGRVTATVVFHPVTQLSLWHSRRALANHCQQVIGQGVVAANGGRMTGVTTAGDA
jgi:1-acyl-sn-glycerol-3-phosphate acyltransferase